MPGQRINPKILKCKERLFGLFEGFSQQQGLNQQLNGLHSYYSKLFDKAEYEIEEAAVVQEYSEFIELLQKVKEGQLTAGQAKETAEDSILDKNCISLCEDLFNLCEAIFWGTVACLAYVGCCTIGIPLIFCDPLIGLAITLPTAALAICSTELFLDTLDEFAAYDGHDQALENQKNLISALSMFKTPRTTPETSSEEDLQLACH